MIKCENCEHWYNNHCDNVKTLKYNEFTFPDNACDFGQPKLAIKTETVNHPTHYNQGIEAIDIIESWGLNFSLGNAIKYILRSPHKGNQVEDLKKSVWYIQREIDRLENKNNTTKE